MKVNESIDNENFDEGVVKTLHFYKAVIEGVFWFILAAIIYHKFDTAVELITHINSWHVDNFHSTAYLVFFLITMIAFFFVHFTSLAFLKLVLCLRK